MRESDMNRRVSEIFLKDVSERFNKLKLIIKDTGIEFPSSIECTLKQLSSSSNTSLRSASDWTRANLSLMQEEPSPTCVANNIDLLHDDINKISSRIQSTKSLLLLREKENDELKQMISQLENKYKQSKCCCILF